MQQSGGILVSMDLELSPALAVLRQKIPGLAGVYLFGSHASGDARADSDVDLAVYAGPPLARTLLRHVQGQLSDVLKREVDLVDLSAVPTILQVQVIDEGKLIDAPEPDATALFELRAIRDYQDLKERRAATEADIVRRGRVYAG